MKSSLFFAAVGAFFCSLSAQHTIPYQTSFESVDGFSLGNSASGILGWQDVSGISVISNEKLLPNSYQSLKLLNASEVKIELLRNQGLQIEYTDFWIFGSADDFPGVEILASADSFTIGTSNLPAISGVSFYLWDDVEGWLDSNTDVPDVSGVFADWHRVTIRTSYTTNSKDLYIDGKLRALNVGGSDFAEIDPFTVSFFTDTDTFLWVDNFLVDSVNPLFTDADNDGIDDAWELSKGLNLYADDRNWDMDSDGLDNVSEYLYQTEPGAKDTDADGLNDFYEVQYGRDPNNYEIDSFLLANTALRLWLKAGEGVDLDGSSLVSEWHDQSGLGNDATQVESDHRPSIKTGALGEQPAVEFDGSNDHFDLPYKLFDGAVEAEGFALVKVADDRTNGYPTLWQIGSNTNTSYPTTNESSLRSSFGLSNYYDINNIGVDLRDYHLVHVSAKSGEWKFRIDGQTKSESTNPSIGFADSPFIGERSDHSYRFDGEIAEILLFDQVLEGSDRYEIYDYLSEKYGLDLWLDEDADGLSDSWEIECFGDLSETSDGDYDGDGLSNAQEYGLGEDPTIAGTFSGIITIDGIKTWLKADGGVELDFDSQVSVWRDQSGLGNDAVQADQSQRPVVRSEALGGKPAIEFDGSNDQFDLPFKMFDGATEAEGFALVKVSDDRTSDYSTLWQIGSSNNSYYFLTNPNAIRSSFAINTYKDKNPVSLDTRDYHLLHVSAKNGEWILRMDGNVQISQSNLTIAFTDSPTIAGRVGETTRGFDGEIAEVLLFDQVLEGNDRYEIYDYLNEKYGLGLVLDEDGDGMSDVWEHLFFSNLTQDGGGDADGDGSTDLEEYINGTFPVLSSELRYGYDHFEAESADESQGLQINENEITNIQDGGWICFNQLYFSGKDCYLRWRQKTGSFGGTIELRVNSPTGELIGVFETGINEGIYSNKIQNVNEIDDVINLYLIFRSSEDQEMAFDWIEFIRADRDEDDDTLPDYWEFQNYGDLSSDGSFDLDGDGLSDAGEFEYGRNPNVAESDSVVFSPGGLRLWLKADQIEAVEGEKISRWNDQSGLGHDAIQSNDSYKAVFVSNAVNGFPVARFDGSDDQYTLGNIMGEAQSGEMYAVVRANPPLGGRGGVIVDLGNTYWSGQYPKSGSNVIVDNFGTGTDFQTGELAQDLSQFHLYSAMSAPNDWRCWINGKSVFNSPSNTVSFDTNSRLGYGRASLNGDIAEILVFDHVLSAEEKYMISAYLGNKYGLIEPSIAVEDFSAVAISGTEVQLNWVRSDRLDQQIYFVERKIDGGNWVEIGESVGSGYLDANLIAGSQYSYRVRIRSLAGYGVYSDAIDVYTLSENTSLPFEGLRLWLKADQIEAVEGEKISRWNDQSGLGHDAIQSNDSYKAVFVSNAVNGFPVARFDGSDDQYTLGNIMGEAQSGEMYAVVRADPPLGGRGGVIVDLGNTYWSGQYPKSGSNVIVDNFGTGTDFQTGELAQDLSQFHLYSAMSAPNDWRCWINGKSVFNSPSNTVSFDTNSRLGYGRASLNGDIAEILVFDHVLTEQERINLKSYFFRKYNFEISLFEDEDADNLADSWEYQYFGDLSYSGDQDPDGDGYSNSEEFSLGWDPMHRTVYQKFEAESYDANAGVEIVDTKLVDSLESGDWISFSGVDFGEAGGRLLAYLSSDVSGATFEIRLGSPTGVLISTVSIDSTGGNNYFSYFRGDFSVDAGLHDLFLVFSNPLNGTIQLDHIEILTPDQFMLNEDLDELPDYWENRYFDSVTAQDDEDPDHDLITNKEEYELGTNPLVHNEIPNYGLKLLVNGLSVKLGEESTVEVWSDLSEEGNDAVPEYSDHDPFFAQYELNHHGTIQFSGNEILKLPDFMSLASSGEILYVLKPVGTSGTLTDFGISRYVSSIYPTGIHSNFGTEQKREVRNPIQPLTDYVILDEMSAPNDWRCWINGYLELASDENTVSFNQNPKIGPFVGEIAEIIVFDRALSEYERDLISHYLVSKYELFSTPEIVGGFSVQAVSSEQVYLSWQYKEHLDRVKYVIERKEPGGAFETLAEVEGCDFFDENLDPNTTYVYRVSATSWVGESDYTSEIATQTWASEFSSIPTSGMRLWLRGDSRGSNDGARMLKWEDSSESENHGEQSNIGYAPTFVANVLNGHSVISFDSDKFQSFNLPDLMNLPESAQEADIFVVTRARPIEGIPNPLWSFHRFDLSGLYVWQATLFPNEVGDLSYHFGSAHGTVSSLTSINQFGVYNVATTSSDWSIKYDGDLLDSGSSSGLDWSNPSPCIGARPYTVLTLDQQAWFNGDIAEIILFDRVLNVGERSAVETYLNIKYDLSSEDFTAPTEVSGIHFDNQSLNGFSISWDASDDDSGVVFYEVYLDGDLYVSTDSNCVEIVGLLPDTFYEINIRARDKFGNASDFSDSVIGATADTIPPLVPINLRLTSLTDTSLGLVWHPSQDNYGVSGYTIFENGVEVTTVTETSALLTNLVPNTDYQFTVAAFDDAANFSEETPILVVRTSPQPPTNIAVEELTPFSVLTSWTASTSSNSIIGYNIYLNGVLIDSTDALGYDFQYLQPATNYEIKVTTIDNQGTQSALSAQLEVTTPVLDVNPPSSPSNLSSQVLSDNTIQISWDSGIDDSGVVYYSIFVDGVVVAHTTGNSYIFEDLFGESQYTVTIQAADSSGNLSSLSNQIVVNPSVSIPFTSYGLALWLDADSSGGVDGSPLAIWNDLSGNNKNATQSISDWYPVYHENELNGHSVIRFDSSQRYDLQSVFSGATSGEIFYVVKVTGDGAPISRFGTYTYAGGGSTSLSNNSINDGFGSTSGKGPGVVDQPLGIFNIYSTSSAPNDWKARINGSLAYKASSNSVAFASNATLGHFVGDIAEVLAFNRTLTDKERENVNRYLASKYQLFSDAASLSDFNVTAIGDSKASLSWNPAGRDDRVVYEIERKSGSASFVKVGESIGTGYLDEILDANTKYTYRVRARTLVGHADYSQEVSITTAAELSPPFSKLGLRLWMTGQSVPKSDLNMLRYWNDISDYNHIGTSQFGYPFVVTNEVGGQSVVRFPPEPELTFSDVMNGAPSGEIFYVTRVNGDDGSTSDALSGFGTYTYAGGGSYTFSSNWIDDGFGTDTIYKLREVRADLSEFNIYNTLSKTGLWQARLNGILEYTREENTVAFSSSPLLGSFDGDFAEILLYDRVLTPEEREAVNAYLAQKYSLYSTPSSVSEFSAIPLSENEIALNWSSVDRKESVVFEVYRKQMGQAFVLVGETKGLGYIDDNLSSGENYVYRVRMRSPSGFGPFSEEITPETLVGISGFSKDHLRLWLRPETIDASEASIVKFWPDSSGSGIDAYSGISTSPSLLVNELNGYPVLSFTDDQCMDLPDVMSDASQGEVFYVVRATGDGHNLGTALSLFGTYRKYGGGSYTLSSNRISDGFGTDHVNGISDITHDLGSFVVYNTLSAPDLWEARINGDLVGSNNENNVAFGTDAKFGDFVGDIAEIIVFDKVLDSTEREKVNSYLAKKYDLFDEPIPVENLKATDVSSEQIFIGWGYVKRNDNVTYEIERKTPGGDYVKIAETSNAGYFDAGLSANTQYEYRVRMRCPMGLGEYSNEISVVTKEVGAVSIPTEDLRLWLKSTSFDSTVDPVIRVWSDDSRWGNNATGSAESGPLLVSDELNGYPVIRFDSSVGNFLTLPNLMNLPEVATAAEIYTVVKSSAPDGKNNPLWSFQRYFEQYYANFYYPTYFPNENGLVDSRFGTNSTPGELQPSTSLDQFNVYSVSTSDGGWSVYLNGLLLGNGVNGDLSWTVSSPVIGVRPGSYYGDGVSTYFDGDIAEILIFDKELSAEERQTVNDYLKAKYDLDTIDRELPSAPTGLTSSSIHSGGFQLSWTPSADNVGIAGYDIYLDGVYIGQSQDESYQFSDLIPFTSYTVSIVAIDYQGNRSETSETLTVETDDTSAPTTPEGLTVTSLNQNSMTISWNASSDDIAVSSYEIYLDGTWIGTTTETSFSIEGLDFGSSYTVSVIALDASGNASEATIPFEIETPEYGNWRLVSTVGAGDAYSSILLEDGSLFLWGKNHAGQLAEPISTCKLAPDSPVSGIQPVAVSVGASHVLIQLDDGRVFAWGENENGQLGIGNTTATDTPTELTGILTTGISAGISHSLAITPEGTVLAWGANGSGQLGTGDTLDSSVPTAVSGLTSVVSVAAGSNFSVALKSDGTVWTWGLNDEGQLGLGDTVNQTSAAQVSSLSDIVQIFAGGGHVLALKSDGTVWGWGRNTSGQLGLDHEISQTSPVQIANLSSVVFIATGADHTLALAPNGNVLAFGSNEEHQISEQEQGLYSTPITIENQGRAVSIAAGNSHSLIRLEDGRILGFGSNGFGELGDGVSHHLQPIPTQVSTLTSVTHLDVSENRGAILSNGGECWIWSTDSDIPELLSGASFGDIATGDRFYVAVDGSGDLWSWGSNENGQLGDGSFADASSPAQITSGVIFKSVDTGSDHSVALKSDGSLVSWGVNSHGALGDGTLVDNNLPTAVTGITSVDSVVAGDQFTIALKTDGTVWSWGRGTEGQLGHGEDTDLSTPTQISSLSSIDMVFLGPDCAFAIKDDGTVYAWGSNENGKLGLGVTTAYLNTPTQITGIAGVAKIVAGTHHALFVLSDGTLMGAGNNDAFQLPGLATTDYLVPTQIPDFSGVVSADTAGDACYVILSDGTVRGWGSNPVMSIGNATKPRSIVSKRWENSNSDLDQDALPDSWEIAKFGSTSELSSADFDSDGLSNIQEFLYQTDPTVADIDIDKLTDSVDPNPFDSLNGLVPEIVVLSGDNQSQTVGLINTLPLQVLVTEASSGLPLPNVEVEFQVLNGDGKLSPDDLGTSFTSSVGAATNDFGNASAHFRQPMQGGLVTRVIALVGNASVIFSTQSTYSATDTDSDNLDDSWEQTYFGDLDETGDGDFDSDGLSNREEQLLGTDPTVANAVDTSSVIDLEIWTPLE